MKKESPVFLFLSALLSNFIDQAFSILPSKTRIGDRASRGHVVADVLASFEQVALDHDTFDKFVKFRIAVAAVENFVYDTDLLLVFLVGVRMIGINDDSRVLEILLAVQVVESDQIFIMIVRNCLSILVDTSTEDGVGQVVTGCLNITSTINEMMRMLCSSDGIKHNGEVAAGRVLHADRDIHSAGGKAVLLVLNRACADSLVREDIVEVTSVFRVKHFIGR